jgi:hypothetical protein
MMMIVIRQRVEYVVCCYCVFVVVDVVVVKKGWTSLNVNNVDEALAKFRGSDTPLSSSSVVHTTAIDNDESDEEEVCVV